MEIRTLYNSKLSEKVLYTAFLLLMGIGYLMAITYLYTSFQGIDNKPGLSVTDVAENYYGNRSGSRMEAAIRGPMANFIKQEERHHIIEWLNTGASENKYNKIIRPLLAKNCFGCHSPESGLKVPNFTSYQSMSDVIKTDTGVSIHTLMKVSHIHLFGIGLLLLGVGMIFRRVIMPEYIKAVLVATPFLAIAVDILAWFLTKWDPVYAYIIVVAGAIVGISLAAQIVISIYQIWISRYATNVQFMQK